MVRVYALLAVGVLVALIILYTKEFDWLNNTIHARKLVIGSMAGGVAVTGGVLWRFRERFTPVSRHLPEIGVISLLILFFSPLLGSLLNRIVGSSSYEQFIFKSEQAYISKGYGILKTESIRPSGWILTVERNHETLTFRYKDQPYFPITNPGEVIELPIRHGLLGFEVVEL